MLILLDLLVQNDTNIIFLKTYCLPFFNNINQITSSVTFKNKNFAKIQILRKWTKLSLDGNRNSNYVNKSTTNTKILGPPQC